MEPDVNNIKDSKTQKRFFSKLKEIGLSPKYNHLISKMHVDIAFPDDKLVIEVDGPDHNKPEQKKVDCERDRQLQMRGWRVIRIPATEVYDDETKQAYKIKHTLDSIRRLDRGESLTDEQTTLQEVKQMKYKPKRQKPTMQEKTKYCIPTEREGINSSPTTEEYIYWPNKKLKREHQESIKHIMKKNAENRQYAFKSKVIIFLVTGILAFVFIYFLLTGFNSINNNISINSQQQTPDITTQDTASTVIEPFLDFQKESKSNFQIKQEIANKIIEYESSTTGMAKISVFSLAQTWGVQKPIKNPSGMPCSYTMYIPGYQNKYIVTLIFQTDCLGGRNKNGYSVDIVYN